MAFWQGPDLLFSCIWVHWYTYAWDGWSSDVHLGRQLRRFLTALVGLPYSQLVAMVWALPLWTMPPFCTLEVPHLRSYSFQLMILSIYFSQVSDFPCEFLNLVFLLNVYTKVQICLYIHNNTHAVNGEQTWFWVEDCQICKHFTSLSNLKTFHSCTTKNDLMHNNFKV